MISNRGYRIVVLILASFFLAECTKELPLEAVFTEDTDWTPGFYVTYNGYQRIELEFDRPPRKELLRNIAAYIVQIKPRESATYTTIDTLIGKYISPSYLVPNYRAYYRSKPVLSWNTDYTLRLLVSYRNGEVKWGYESYFTTPSERGKVLHRVPLPKKTSGAYWFGDYVVYHKGKLIVLRDEELFQVDTSSGEAVSLKQVFAPPEGDPNLTFRALAICGDILITYYPALAFTSHTIVRLDMTTQVVDSSLQIPYSGNYIVSVVGRGSLLYILWGTPGGGQQFTAIDPRTGQTLQVFAEAPARITYPWVLSSDGAGLWTLDNKSFDNRVLKLDPSTLTFLEVHHNPIFDPEGLAWDGSHFWMIDRETQTIAKLQLEGL